MTGREGGGGGGGEESEHTLYLYSVRELMVYQLSGTRGSKPSPAATFSKATLWLDVDP